MKRCYEGLSLEILERKNTYVIVVEDKTKGTDKVYREKYEAPKNDEKAKFEMLNNAREWLWNMGNYNGQANVLMRRCYSQWLNKLNIKTSCI